LLEQEIISLQQQLRYCWTKNNELKEKNNDLERLIAEYQQELRNRRGGGNLDILSLQTSKYLKYKSKYLALKNINL
jgi:hypothetical protein